MKSAKWLSNPLILVLFELKVHFLVHSSMGFRQHSGSFLGMEITNNGILMTTDYQGRSSGEAYVQFASKSDAERALEKNKQSIGHRWVFSWLGGTRIFGKCSGIPGSRP